jgi:spore coat polysaccharide biosynthesis predicted glycosyltransferase SpsG
MRFVFRADASQDMGAGHVMRCSAIAEELIANGEEAIFIGSMSELKWLKQRILNLGFTKIYDTSEEFLPNQNTDILILDSYVLNVNHQFLNPKNWYSVIAIVDSVTPNYRCQLRIHPGLDSEWNSNIDTPLLYGPSYIPLRKEITKIDLNVKKSSAELSIIISSGGTDAFGLVDALASILNATKFEFKASLFMNSTPPKKLDNRFNVLPLGPDLDLVAETADLVFTTASTSALEFIARGLPVGVVCAVENQESYYKVLTELEVASPVGSRNSGGYWDLNQRLIEELVSSSEFRRRLSARSSLMIDMNGAKRIVDEIKSLY